MHRLHDAINKATTDAALFMTADLRKKAAGGGWNKDVINNMRVRKRDGKYDVHFSGSVADDAFVHEYGDPDNTPSAVIRKYDNSHSDLAAFYSERVMKHMGGND